MFKIAKKNLNEKTLATDYIYRGRIINVRQDQVCTDEGDIAFREVVEHPGAVAVMALDDENKIVLVRQYRQPAKAVLYEIPAGKLEPNEDPLVCAKRELLEETSFKAERWEKVFSFYTSPGFCDEVIHLFKAQKIRQAPSPGPDPDEIIETIKVPLGKAALMIEKGEIVDGKSIIAIQNLLIHI